MSSTSMIERGFPLDLLTAPPADRLQFFVAKLIAHQRLKETHTTLWQAIQQPAGAELVLVYGPSGVGKTTLRGRLEAQLNTAASADPNRDPAQIPVVSLELVAPDGGNFDWKDYYLRLLAALDEPLLAHKLPAHPPDRRRDEHGRLRVDRTTPAATLRRILEECLHQRRPQAIILDEAQHLTKLATGRRLLDQMDCLKSLASLTGVVHVLLGTYDLLRLTNLNGQLSRRSREIHFGRYHADQPADLAEFQKVLRTLAYYLPLAQEPQLEAQTLAFYEGSLGCVGLLKTWLNQALAAALAEDAATMLPRHWQQFAEPVRRLQPRVHELLAGEQALCEDALAPAALRALLGLPPAAPAGLPAHPDEVPSAPARTKPAGRVGERLPHRDPIGQLGP